MAVDKHAMIHADEEGVTLVNLYEVAPERQDELIALLGEVTDRWSASSRASGPCACTGAWTAPGS